MVSGIAAVGRIYISLSTLNHRKMIMNKKLTIGVIAMSLLGVMCLLLLFNRHQRLKPKLLFSLRSEECGQLTFGAPEVPWQYICWTHPVNSLCRKHGFTEGPFFATFEKKVVRFRLDRFMGHHGDIECVPGEKGTVYFYQYHKRYEPIVQEP